MYVGADFIVDYRDHTNGAIGLRTSLFIRSAKVSANAANVVTGYLATALPFNRWRVSKD